MAINERSYGVITHGEACQTLFDLLAAHADVDVDIAETTAIVDAAPLTVEALREYAEAVDAIRGGYHRLAALHRELVAPVESPLPAPAPVRPVVSQPSLGQRLRKACAVPALKLRPRLIAYPSLGDA